MLDSIKNKNILTEKLLTISYIRKGDEVLMGLKKRGWGANKWNGFGGKLQAGETIEQAAKREIKEECNLEVLNLIPFGTIDFYFNEGDDYINICHIFICDDYIGDIVETEEMEPRWFKTNEIPFSQMWRADSYWIPIILNNKKVKGEFLYDKPSSLDYDPKILEYKIEEYD